MTVDLISAKKEVIETAKEAGEIVKKYYGKDNFSSRAKSEMDFATQADDEVDKFLNEELLRKFPNTKFLTEESAPDDYSNLKNEEYLWVIDPIDGTVNFSKGTPHFAISIALVSFGEPILAIVYMPILEKLYFADKNSRAYLNDEEIHISEVSELPQTVINTDWPWSLEKRAKVSGWVERLYKKVRQLKIMGCAALDICSLAEGRIDAYLHAGLSPWDFAAAVLIAEKAGAKLSTPTGEKLNIFNPEVLITNGLLHEKIFKEINE